jgi:hypothetical protein
MTTNEIIATASLMGLAGSIHCVGMCGPLALALPLQHRNDAARAVAGTVYNSGRVLSYTVMGAVLGSAGQLMISSQWQSRLSVALGVLILLYLLLPAKYKHLPAQRQPFAWVRRQLGRLLQAPQQGGLFAVGMLNGLLPCGLVYLALGSAAVTGSVVQGALFMLFFGLGTFPLMWATVFMGGFIGQGIRQKLSKAMPVMLLLMAVLLIVRGLGLGIPYLSPVINAGGEQVAVGCH